MVNITASRLEHTSQEAISEPWNMNISFSWSVQAHNQGCEHIGMVRACGTIEIKLRSIIYGKMNTNIQREKPKDWLSLKIPTCDDDVFSVWYVYKPY